MLENACYGKCAEKIPTLKIFEQLLNHRCNQTLKPHLYRCASLYGMLR